MERFESSSPSVECNKDQGTVVTQIYSDDNDLDFSFIERKIFEGTGFQPTFCKSKKNLKANVVGVQFKKNAIVKEINETNNLHRAARTDKKFNTYNTDKRDLCKVSSSEDNTKLILNDVLSEQIKDTHPLQSIKNGSSSKSTDEINYSSISLKRSRSEFKNATLVTKVKSFPGPVITKHKYSSPKSSENKDSQSSSQSSTSKNYSSDSNGAAKSSSKNYTAASAKSSSKNCIAAKSSSKNCNAAKSSSKNCNAAKSSSKNCTTVKTSKSSSAVKSSSKNSSLAKSSKNSSATKGSTKNTNVSKSSKNGSATKSLSKDKNSSNSSYCNTDNALLKDTNSTKSSSRSKPTTKSHNKRTSCDQSLSSASESSDWEDVDMSADLPSNVGHDEMAALQLLSRDGNLLDGGSTAPAAASVQIELDAPQLWGKKRKKRKTERDWLMEYLRRRANQRICDNFLNCHKVHLLLLLQHGLIVNRQLNSQQLLMAALSIVTNKDVYPPKRIDLDYLEKFTRWFTKKISFVENLQLEKGYWSKSLEELLTNRFERKQACTHREFVFMFILVSRTLGMTVRLVQSLKPLHFKPQLKNIFKGPSKCEEEKNSLKKIENCSIKENKSEKLSNIVSNGTPNASTSGNNKRKKTPTSESEDDSDFDLTVSNKSKKKSKKNNKKRSLSVESSTKSTKKKKVENGSEWAEVYVEEEEQWICVDVLRGKIHCAVDLMSHAGGSAGYVTAFNPDQSARDVTKRYVNRWLTYEPKLRCDSAWWAGVLLPLRPPSSARDAQEDEQMDDALKRQPLPKTVGEYKNHPLYALQRHLLKFEALYPPNLDPVGFVRGEAVYPRSCVSNLHSRDVWLKEAKTVVIDEEAYKVVMARPKWDRVNHRAITDQPLDLFGSWQVEDYCPPVAKDGRVPRNEYGNVELFKESMIPGGCVHLGAVYEDIGRVARKLGIDCAPAMVGFDFHRGGTHPVFDGYIVCMETEDLLLDALREERQLKAARESAKRLKRIYNNWKRLIQGLLIRRHVREAYGGDDSDAEQSSRNDNEATAISDKSVAGSKATATSRSKKMDGRAKKTKTKIKQEDLNSAVPTINYEKQKLDIDMSSDTVSMAKKSFKDAIVSRYVVSDGQTSQQHQHVLPKKEDSLLGSDDEVKETEEQKKENLKKVLAWDDSALGSLAGLSDDSDEDEPRCGDIKHTADNKLDIKPTSSSASKLSLSRARLMKTTVAAASDSSSDSEPTSAADVIRVSSASPAERKRATSDTPADKNCCLRRTSRRVKAAPIISCAEDSEVSDISLGESDFEDKTYKPDEGAPT